MLAKEMMDQVVHALLDKTRKREVVWTYRDGVYTVHLPNSASVVLSGKDFPGRVGATREYDFSILTDGGLLVGEVKSTPGQALFPQLEELAISADQSVSNLVSGQILDIIKQGGLIGTTPFPTGMLTAYTASGPVATLPPQPTKEQESAFFDRIKGKWQLDYTFGQEVVEIDKDGNYKCSGKNREGRTYNNSFKLALLASNPDLSKVEIGKDRLDGKRHSIEVLSVFNNRMDGEAKSDRHRLAYVRMGA